MSSVLISKNFRRTTLSITATDYLYELKKKKLPQKTIKISLLAASRTQIYQNLAIPLKLTLKVERYQYLRNQRY